jgi:tetratricopeptide (TPR) repeat protein
MGNQNTSPPYDSTQISAAFSEELKKALDYFNDPTWLGENSSLAAPYFLGDLLSRKSDRRVNDAKGRGEALRELLREAAEILAAQDRERNPEGINHGELIRLAFFNPVPLTAEGIAAGLNTSRANYFYHRKKAIPRLEEAFVRRVNPALRLELPRHRAIVGRDEPLAACTQALEQGKTGKTVGLTGLGGIGKTALGGNLALKLAGPATFWLTFRPGLNDRLSNLIFGLGYFFHRLGTSNLWGELVACEGQLKPEVALSLIRHDLERVQGRKPLLCFDEIDLLRPAESEAHAQILAFLESLRGLTRLLLIGQHLVLEPDLRVTLSGLSLADVEAMLARAQIQLRPDDMVRLHTYTHGNPRLLELFIALHRAGEPLTEALSARTGVPSTEYLLDRIWRRLPEDEQVLLTELAVFRGAAPGDAWNGALPGLIHRYLVQADGQGGVTLLQAFKDIIYRQLPPENRQALHLRAAQIRAARGEYTPAAYHYIQGGQPQVAIWLWHKHQTREINQGQTEAALALFREVPLYPLDAEDQEALIVLRATLYKMVGEYGAVRRDLRRSFWDSPVLKVQASRLEGDVADLRSDFERARRAYREGLETVERLMSERALFHKNLGWVLMRQKDLDQAWEQARLAEYEAQNLEGYIQVERGNFGNAETHYRTALSLAQDLGYVHGEAKTRDNLGALLSRQAKHEEAFVEWQAAGQLYKRINYMSGVAGVAVNLAFGYNLAGQPERAIPPAEEAMELFRKLGQVYGQAVAAQNLAEAHLALGDLAQAERFARRVTGAEEKSTLPDGLRVLGIIRTQQRKFSKARRFFEQSIQTAQQNGDRYLEAYAWRDKAQLEQAAGRPGDAAAAFKRAIELFEALDLPDEVEKTRREAGDEDE